MNTLSWTMALLMGMAGSLHCAGMCGPIVWVMPFQALKGIRKATALAIYHAGRISVYALMAVILHSFRDLFEPKIQQYISMILGGALLLAGVFSFLPNHKFALRLPWAEQVKKHLGHFIGNPRLGALAAAGMLNGLLPCGLVYMALSATLPAQGALRAALIMYAFGIGTLPMLIGITLLRTRLGFLRTNHIRKLVPVIVFSFGFIFMLRGMNLGIPYLSPRVAVAGNEIKSCCCHKP